MLEEVLWSEKYRPKTVEDCILPPDLKSHFQSFVDTGDIPNLILAGGHGRGKTTIARAMLEQVGSPYMIKNGSLEVNMDALRNEIGQFASSMSLKGKRKFVIFDEADWLSQQHVQPALRAYMQQFSKTCGFIFTCNYKDRLMVEIHSRCSVIDFTFQKTDAPDLIKALFRRVCNILNEEGVEYDKKAVAEFIKMYYPDFRRIIGELQSYSKMGSITSGIFAHSKNESLKDLFERLKDKNWSALRKWCGETDFDEINMMRRMFDGSDPYVTVGGNATLVYLIGDYMAKHAVAADKQLNFMAFLVAVMHDVEFK